MKKPQKKHLFARACRVSGRFLLIIGATLCAASVVYALAPLLYPSTSSETQTAPTQSISDAPMAFIPPSPATITSTDVNPLPYILPAIIVAAIFIIAIAISFHHYNKSIRNLIARIANALKLNIHVTELLLTTVVWCVANFIIALTIPVFTVLTFIAMVLNLLAFIFAWTSYGCPVYTI